MCMMCVDPDPEVYRDYHILVHNIFEQLKFDYNVDHVMNHNYQQMIALLTEATLKPFIKITESFS